MPIEIKELHIKGVLTNENESGNNNQSSSQPDQKALIEACVEKVLRILDTKKER